MKVENQAMFWIDAHSHISFFDKDRVSRILKCGREKNLKYWIMAGYDESDWEKQLTIAREHSSAVAKCFGLHPWQVLKMSQNDIDAIISKLELLLPSADALGETGVDKFKTADPIQVQKQLDVFLRHLELNKNYQLPLVIHSVHAETETLKALKAYTYKGIIHGFSGSYESAQRFIDLGYKISVGRGLYSQGYSRLKDCIQKLSLNDFIIESDAAIDDNGTAEDPVSIFFKVVEAICEIRKVSAEDLMEKSFVNTRKVFSL